MQCNTSFPPQSSGATVREGLRVYCSSLASTFALPATIASSSASARSVFLSPKGVSAPFPSLRQTPVAVNPRGAEKTLLSETSPSHGKGLFTMMTLGATALALGGTALALGDTAAHVSSHVSATSVITNVVVVVAVLVVSLLVALIHKCPRCGAG